MKRHAPAHTGPGALTMRWVPVVDDTTGRTRMEMRWSAPRPVARITAA